MLVINGASVMRITYARVWIRLIRIESELAGFAFNVLLNSHSCRQASDVSYTYRSNFAS